MKQISYHQLSLNNTLHITAFEKALYRAYAYSSSDLPSEEFVFDRHAKQGKHVIPYEKLMIFAALREDAVIASLVVNTDISMSKRLKNNVPSNKKACEVLFMFSLLGGTDGMSVLGKLGNFARDYVKNMDVEVIYAFPCSSKAVMPYERSGFKKADTSSGTDAIMMYMST